MLTHFHWPPLPPFFVRARAEILFKREPRVRMISYSSGRARSSFVPPQTVLVGFAFLLAARQFANCVCIVLAGSVGCEQKEPKKLSTDAYASSSCVSPNHCGCFCRPARGAFRRRTRLRRRALRKFNRLLINFFPTDAFRHEKLCPKAVFGSKLLTLYEPVSGFTHRMACLPAPGVATNNKPIHYNTWLKKRLNS